MQKFQLVIFMSKANKNREHIIFLLESLLYLITSSGNQNCVKSNGLYVKHVFVGLLENIVHDALVAGNTRAIS